MNVPRFKQIFEAVLLRWKIRRIMTHLKKQPQIREAIDYVNLRIDIGDDNPKDAFSKKIIDMYPLMRKLFQDSFYEIIDNGEWIQDPNSLKKYNKSKTINASDKLINSMRSKTNKVPTKRLKTQKATKKPVQAAIPLNKVSKDPSVESNDLSNKSMKSSTVTKNSPGKANKSPKAYAEKPRQMHQNSDSKKHAKAQKRTCNTSRQKYDDSDNLMGQTLNGEITWGHKINIIEDVRGLEADLEEQEDRPGIPPVMEQKPDFNLTMHQRLNPLDDLKATLKGDHSRNKYSDTLRVNRNSRRSKGVSKSISSMRDIKLVSLQEKRSITRGFKMHAEQPPAMSNGLDKYKSKSNEVVMEKNEESPVKIKQLDKFETFKVFSQ